MRVLANVVIPVLIVALGVFGYVALVKSRPETLPVAVPERVWNVAAIPAKVDAHRPELTLFGRVMTPRLAHLRTTLSADVVEVHVLEGESVEPEQLLIELDDREARLALAQRAAEVAEIRAEIEAAIAQHATNTQLLEYELELLTLAEREVDRARELAGKKLGSAATVDGALQSVERQRVSVANRRLAIRTHSSELAKWQARLAKAEALRDLANLDVERTRVRAPFRGKVSDVAVAHGDRVRPGDVLVEIFDRRQLEVRAQVPTRYIATFRENLDRGNALLARGVTEGIAFRARATRLTAEIERGRGGADAFFTIDSTAALGAANRPDDASLQLELGRTVELTVSLPAEPASVLIPPQSLYEPDRLFKLDDGRLKTVAITRLGERRDADGQSRLIIRSPDIADGDVLLATQLPNAVDGLKVIVVTP